MPWSAVSSVRVRDLRQIQPRRFTLNPLERPLQTAVDNQTAQPGIQTTLMRRAQGEISKINGH
jgi:hypothetical protein